jgi:hypothetical protein
MFVAKLVVKSIAAIVKCMKKYQTDVFVQVVCVVSLCLAINPEPDVLQKMWSEGAGGAVLDAMDTVLRGMGQEGGKEENAGKNLLRGYRQIDVLKTCLNVIQCMHGGVPQAPEDPGMSSNGTVQGRRWFSIACDSHPEQRSPQEPWDLCCDWASRHRQYHLGHATAPRGMCSCMHCTYGDPTCACVRVSVCACERTCEVRSELASKSQFVSDCEHVLYVCTCMHMHVYAC